MLAQLSVALLALLPYVASQAVIANPSAAVRGQALGGPAASLIPLTATVAGCENVQLGAYPLGPTGVLTALGLVAVPALATTGANDATCVCVQANVGQPTTYSVTASTLNSISLLQIPTILNTANAVAGTVAYSTSGLLNLLDNEAIASLNSGGINPQGCIYPTGASPSDCSGGCGFTCQAGYTRCSSASSSTGYTCVAGNTCPSGTVPRKRGEYYGNINSVDRHCAAGKTACATSSTFMVGGTGLSFECIDTDKNLESCGGCTFPLPGRATGQDCTAISNALAVDCVSGQCIVNSCAHDFVVSSNATACEPVDAHRSRAASGRSRYRRALKEALSNI